MPREWVGSTYRSKGRETWEAKWKEWGTDRWRVTKGFRTEAEAQDFVTAKRRDYRQRRRGDHDPFAQWRRLPIKDHVEAFIVHVLSHRRRAAGARRSEKHGNQCRARLTAAFLEMGVHVIGDVESGRVDRFLGALLDAGRAVKTRNDYAALLCQFVRWAVAAGRLERDPLGNVRFLDASAGAKQRQTLTWQDVRSLAAAAVQRVAQNAPAKRREEFLEIARRRGLAVITMFLTGLRNNEVAHLAWDWIEDGVVTVPHTVTKSGRTEYLPLHAGLAELLTQERARRAVRAGAPVGGRELVVGTVVGGVPQLPRWINERLREDAKWVRLPAVDARGRVLSIYSMRTSFATQLAELGVPDGIVSELMRHRPRTVTLQHYVQRSVPMLRAAIDMIPAEAAAVPGLFESSMTVGDQTSDQDGCARVRSPEAGRGIRRTGGAS